MFLRDSSRGRTDRGDVSPDRGQGHTCVFLMVGLVWITDVRGRIGLTGVVHCHQRHHEERSSSNLCPRTAPGTRTSWREDQEDQRVSWEAKPLYILWAVLNCGESTFLSTSQQPSLPSVQRLCPPSHRGAINQGLGKAICRSRDLPGVAHLRLSDIR